MSPSGHFSKTSTPPRSISHYTLLQAGPKAIAPIKTCAVNVIATLAKLTKCDFTKNLLQLPMMEIVSVWSVNKDLEFVNMPGGRRILINTMTWTK